MYRIFRVTRDSEEMEILVDCHGMRIEFYRTGREALRWEPRGYPAAFVESASEALQPYHGSYRGATYEEFYFQFRQPNESGSPEWVELFITHYVQGNQDSLMSIRLRRTEVVKILDIVRGFWCC